MTQAATETPAAERDAARLMDRIYTRQRHIYDATRKFYLLGRDGLIAGLDVPEGGTVLELGCGTGRNLLKVARRYPTARCCGLDLSLAMLQTARGSVERAGLASRIALAQADATSFDPKRLFSIGQFDRVVISYALSMIPPWRDVLRRGAEVLAPRGSLHIVDFGDQSGLSPVFKSALVAWLASFHVSLRPELPAEANAVAQELGLEAVCRPRLRTYTMTAVLTRRAIGSFSPRGNLR